MVMFRSYSLPKSSPRSFCNSTPANLMRSVLVDVPNARAPAETPGARPQPFPCPKNFTLRQFFQGSNGASAKMEPRYPEKNPPRYLEKSRFSVPLLRESCHQKREWNTEQAPFHSAYLSEVCTAIACLYQTHSHLCGLV